MTAKQEQTNNPYNICSWRPISECEDCPLASRLKCRLQARRDILHFTVPFLFFAIPAFIGMILGGYGWYLLGWAGFMFIFLNFWEIRILCSHCPYYAEKGLILHCIVNYGSLKVWKYHPEPISKLEKVQLVIGLIVMISYPFAFLILDGQLIFILLTACGGIMVFWILQNYTCSRCVNFSCLLNRVPKQVVDEYLKRNPVMRKAWEENGWQLRGTTS